jgi:hypothetical protein
MLPIRRIGTELHEVRWTHVFIELLLLVLGILIALGVDGRLEERRNARMELDYLERLVRDLDQDLGILQEFIEFEERQTDDGVRAFRALRGADVTDVEAVSSALSNLMGRRTLRFVRATYADLLSTGNLRLIRDTSLRDQVVNLYEKGDRLAAVIDRNNQVFVDQMYMQHLLEHGLVVPRAASNLKTIDSVVRPLDDRMGVRVDASGDRLWTLAADSPERATLAGKVRMRTIVSHQAAGQARSHMEQVRSVRDAVGARLRQAPAA